MRAFAKAIEGANALICRTRKTTPGLRAFEKYAVRMGGGINHRFGLFDTRSIDWSSSKRVALHEDAALLDNMSLDELRQAVALAGGCVILEASGGVTLDTVRGIAETGVDLIS